MLGSSVDDMTSQLLDRPHPVTEFAGRLRVRLEELAATSTSTMRPGEQRAALVDLAAAEARLAALRLRVLAEADRSGATETRAACSAADWAAVQTRQTRPSARADLKLARALDRHHTLATALAYGQVNPAQARAIVTALDRLPTSGTFAVTAEQRDRAEQHLVALAADHDAQALGVLGMRIFEVIAPAVAEQFEGRALEAQEAAALRRTTFEIREDGEGTCHGRFRIPALHGQMLRKMLHSLTPPTSDPVERPPANVEHGVAFCDLIERIPAKALPRAGGCSATIVVTITLDQLLADLHTAGVTTLDTGAQISATEARRLACAAGIIPVVLDGTGQVLDVGRRRRFHTPAQRIALMVRDHGCTATDCDRPPAMCHAHHDHPWSHDGPTDVDHARLLCGHHHRRIHDPRYQVTHHPNGKVSFHRRT